jgi:hypothetical protein
VGREAVGCLFRRRRTRQVVDEEYDRGRWALTLAERPWRDCGELGVFLDVAGSGTRLATIDGELVAVSDAEYYRFRAKMLARIVEECATTREVVELGCGWGLNLFTLWRTGQWQRLVGLDVSANAVAAGRAIAAHFGCGEVDFDQLDLTDAKAPNFARLRDRTVLTYYCLEQLPREVAAVIENIRRAAPRRVIHIEPTTELLRLRSPRDLLNYLYIVRHDYQRSLLRTLSVSERAKRIRIVSVRRLFYAPSMRHDPVLACWEPSSVSGEARG